MKILLALSMLFCISQSEGVESFTYEDSCCEEDSSNFYAEIFSGANFLQTKTSGGIKSNFQTGYVIAGSLGYCWSYGIRLEAEYAYRRNSLKSIHFFGRTFSMDGHFQSSSYMANLLWDIPLCAPGCSFFDIQPAIGGGIGYDDQKVHGHSDGFVLNAKGKHFAWQFIGSLSYPIFCNANLSLEYKFHKGGFNYINNHSLGMSLRYNY